MQLSSNKSYGLLIGTILVLTALWMAYEQQASIMHPGWFAGLRPSLWCRTTVIADDPRFDTSQAVEGIFFHYPGKRLPRLMKELGLPLQTQAIYLNANNQDTVCFGTWKEAALADLKFQKVAEGYGELLAGWSEADYQRAVLMLNLQSNGMARLAELLKVKQRAFEQAR